MLSQELNLNYEVLNEKPSEGGMGAVYKARHRHLGRLCVIKVMQANLQENEDARARFLGEARKGHEIRHRNVAEVLDFLIDREGNAYLVIEYVDGRNLREILRERKAPLDCRSAVNLALQALAALGALHAKKLVHRDISPDNLMVTTDEDGTLLLKLIDLGIAKSLDDELQLTHGFFIGKALYAAPEQFAHHLDPRGDLYSLGIVLYELLTGTLPIVGTDFLSIMTAHHTRPPRPFAETDPRGMVPEGVRAVILKVLAKEPEKRYQTADEFAQALRFAAANGEPTIPVRPAPLPERVARPRARRMTVLFLAGLLTAGGLAVAGRQMLHSTQAASGQTSVSAAAAMARGKKLAAQGRLADAYASFMAATRADPSNAFAWANLGGAAALMNRPLEATLACERALQLDGENWLAHYNLACQLARAGKQDEAIQHLGAAMRRLRRETSPVELRSMVDNIRADEALRSLRDDPRFNDLLAN